MKRKTAMMDVIEYLGQQLRLQDDKLHRMTTKEALQDAIEVCQNSLEKEKEQIMEAYKDGWHNAGYKKIPSDYYDTNYNETYKQD